MATRESPHFCVLKAAGGSPPLGGVSDVLEMDDGLYVVMKHDQRDASVTPLSSSIT